MENKIYATVEWYDEKKGFGIAKNNNASLLIHDSYLNNKKQKIEQKDIISCIPVKLNMIYHATKIDIVNKYDKKNEDTKIYKK